MMPRGCMMIELTRRQSLCLRYLCRQDSYSTVAELARHLDVSERTIRSDLKAIDAYVREHGGRLLRVPGTGILLADGQARRTRLLASLDGASVGVLKREERTATAAMLLLVRPITTFELIARACNVSRQTIIGQFDAIDAFFESRGVEVRREQGIGSYLSGDELAIRRCFVWLVTNDPERMQARDTALRELPATVLKEARALVERIERMQGMEFTDLEALRLPLAYTLCRIGENHLLAREAASTNVLDRELLSQDDPYLSALLGLLEADISEQRERFFAASLVLAQRTTGVGRMHRIETGEPDEATLISRDLIAALHELHVIDEGAVQHLIDGLTTHLRAAIYRCRNDIQVENELSQQVMVPIALLYDFTRKEMRRAEQRYGVCLNDAEIAYIAMYLDTIYESSIRDTVALSVLFVCAFGLASSSILMTRLSHALAECEVYGPMTEAEAIAFMRGHDVDLVISTSDCHFGSVPVLTVDPLLSQAELEKVKSRIMQLSYSKMCSYFLRSYSTTVQDRDDVHYVRDFVEPRDIQVNVACSNWRHAIRLAAGPLLERGLIEERYVERMVSAVEDFGPYMVLTPQTAYVHAGVNDGTHANCASVLVLSESIPFGPHHEKQVRCIVVLGIHDKEHSFLLGLAPIFEREETISCLERPQIDVATVLGLHD